MVRVLGDDWTLPALDGRTRPWFASGRLMVQRCLECQTWQHPPEDVCGACQSTRLAFQEAGHSGTIESFVVVHRAVHPKLAPRVPYAVALVALDAATGVNVLGQVRNRAPEQIAIGMRVSAVFEQTTDPESGERLSIPQWEASDPD